MILRRLSLCGITRFDTQVDLDFEALGPGVIAFAGGNGEGKTSILESCGGAALFREMPSRDPKPLHAHTRPGGGWVQLDFDMGADSYQSRVEVDKKGAQAAYLTRNGEAIVSGKVREFDQQIGKLIGTSAAFYASVFGLQGGGGKVASLTVGDRKAIFRWFLGLDRIAKLRDQAAKRLALLDGKEVDRLAIELQRIRDDVTTLDASLPDLQAVLAEAQADATAAKVAREAAAEAITLVERREAALREIRRLDGEVDRTTADAKGKLADLDLVKARAPVDPGPAPADPAIVRKALDEAREAHRKLEALQAEARRLNDAASQAGRDADRASRSAGLLANVPCGGGDGFDGCQFLQDALAARGQLDGLRAAESTAKAAAVKAAREAQAAAANAPDVAALQRQVQAADQAVRTWQAARQAFDKHATAIATADALYRAAAASAILARRTRQNAPGAPEAPAVDVGSLNAAVEAAGKAVARATGDLEHARGQVQALRRQADQTEAKLGKAQDAAADQPALQLLVKALGPDGIQAFEIDAAGPQVAGMANDLLLACYGPRFTVEIQTQRAMRSKDGMDEDLEIIVMDAEAGRSGPIGSLSGGEQVIVDEAVRTALAMFAARRLEAPIRTLFRDESSGALTPENARRYVQMLRRAAEIGDFHQVLFVAHDPDVIACADVVVRVAGGSYTVARL